VCGFSSQPEVQRSGWDPGHAAIDTPSRPHAGFTVACQHPLHFVQRNAPTAPRNSPISSVAPKRWGRSGSVSSAASYLRARSQLWRGACTARPPGVGDDDLIEIASRSPKATICLRSALTRHDLIDDIPAVVDIAIPRGSWAPATTAAVRWRSFDPVTFAIGREHLDIGARSVDRDLLCRAEHHRCLSVAPPRRHRLGQRGTQALAAARRPAVAAAAGGQAVRACAYTAAQDDGDPPVTRISRHRVAWL
jgi:hypothetical protein